VEHLDERVSDDAILPAVLAPGQPVAAAQEPAPAVAGQPLRPGSALGQRLAPKAIGLAAAAGLFFAYLQISRTQPVNSDGASNALQAWDMLHGNLLLHGWILSDVSFYTTELPQYMLVEAVRGLNPEVVHVAAAMTYTLLVVLAALLAKGRASGRQAAMRMAVAAGILAAPLLGPSTYVLLLQPDHVGTCVFLLAVWLLLDRAGRRWWVPPAMGALLAWGLIADPLVFFAGVAPLLLVAGLRAGQEIAVRHHKVRQAWFELALAAAAVAALVVAKAAQALIQALGGYLVWPVGSGVITAGKLTHNLSLTLKGIAVLFGAGYFGVKAGPPAPLILVHWVGLGLAVAAVWVGGRRFFRETSLVTSALTVAVVINVGMYLVSAKALSLDSAREMAPALAFSAVLAGRLLADRLRAARLVPLLAVAVAGYGLSLAVSAASPAAPAEKTAVTSWLARNHYRYGLAGYWNANIVSLTSHNQILIRPLYSVSGRFIQYPWESVSGWYDPQRQYANFVVLGPIVEPYFRPSYAAVVANFGKPAHVYHVGADTILVWHKNLLSQVVTGSWAGVERSGLPTPARHRT
jgi:hypothetical protein